jgi:hypothetical protein
MRKTFTKEQILEAHKNIPDAVREVFGSEETADLVSAIRGKYALHIDVAGVFSKSLGYLLLGLISPQEFLEELVATGVPDKDARGIVVEINQKIFVPLREEEMKTSQPAKSVTPQPPPRPQSLVTPPTAPAPVLPKGIYAPPLQSPRYFHLENKISPPLRPLNAPRSGAPGERSALRNILAAVTKEVPMPMNDEKLLEDHEEPRIEFNKTPPSIVSRITPPQNLPGVILHPPLIPQPRPGVASGEAGPIIPKVEPSAPPKPSVPAAPAKPYSGDPYREPIEP